MGSACDTLVWTEEHEINNPIGLFVFYHSGWQKCFINSSNLKGNNCRLEVFNMKGEKVIEVGKISVIGGYVTYDLDCAMFADGMYVVSLTTEKERLVKKFVKE